MIRNYKTTDGYKLGHWVDRRRTRKQSITPERRQRLEALKGWEWNVLSAQWEEGFEHLKEYADKYGNCRMTKIYKTEDGYTLGQWVRVQRFNKDTMSPERKARLEALEGWVWDARK